MSFSLFKPRYKRRWQVIITKFGKELYNKMYNATDFMLDIRNKTQWRNDYKYEVEHLDDGSFNSYYKFTDGTIVKILSIKEEILI